MVESIPLSPRPAGEIIAELNTRLEAALAPFVRIAPFAILDFPDHANVGDSAIWLGTASFFARYGQRPAYTSSLHTHDEGALQKTVKDGVIFLHGGGNFGTLWPAHQDFRLRVLERFPEHPIIQLPQSIHFENENEAAATARAIERHGNFTLFLRDQPSLEFAQRHFQCESVLAPDMAFGMPRPTRRSPDHKIFCLLRTDKEKAIDSDGLEHDAVSEDWLDENRKQMRRTRMVSKMLGVADPGGSAFRTFHNLATARVKRGIDQLSSGRVVITDRLHAHILSTLVGIPHVTLDNSYRKLGNFIDAWTGSLENHRSATNLPDAFREARSLLAKELAA